MSRLQLSLAMGDYEHTRDIATGDVVPEGIDLMVQRVPIEELLFRFVMHREWQVAEMGLGVLAPAIATGKVDMIGIPVMMSRLFRHGAIYIRTDAGIAKPSDLSGRRIGVPEWGMTAVIYARALLQHGYGVDLRSVKWTQGGLNEPGRVEKLGLRPAAFSITPAPTRALSDLLLAGELDGIISARAPAPLLAGNPRIRRLFEPSMELEVSYWRENRIHPIMHVMAIRRDVHEAYPWVARTLFNAFDEAKRRAFARLHDTAVSHLPIPWLDHHLARARAEMGEDFWPYGIEPNRPSLESFCQYCFEQGVTERRLKVEELFPPQMQGLSRV
jgi:4,5-dihydroxyphthalate decarboxylase